MIEFLKGLSQMQLLVLIILATVIIIEIVYNIIRAVREKKERKKIYGRIDWLPDPSSATINDEMLNKMDYSVAKVDDLHVSTTHAGVGYDYATDEKGRIQICPLPMDTSAYYNGDIVFKDGKTYVVLGDKLVEVR